MSSDLDFGVVSKVPYDPAMNDMDDNFFENKSNPPQPEKVVIQDGHIKNPFYVSANTQLSDMSDSDLYTKYKSVISLCRKNSCNAQQSVLSHMYQRTLKQTEFEELTQYFTIVKVSQKLLKNKYHRNSSLIVERPVLTPFNNSQIYLENEEVVVPLFELSEDQVQLYTSMYESQNTIDIIGKVNVLFQYFTCDSYKTVITERLTKLFSDINETNYWTNPYHCEIDITQRFRERAFRAKETGEDQIKAVATSKNHGIQDSEAKNVFDKISSKISYNTPVIFRKNVFTDASSGVKHTTQTGKKFRLYKLDNELPALTKDQVTEIFNSVNDKKLLFNIFNVFLLSKSYCHLVVNNRAVLTKVKPFFEGKLMAFYNYVFGYAWACLYLEECIVKTRTKNTNRYVFDIDTASKLPFFPYCAENIHMNPYCVLPVDEKVLKSKENFHGLPMIVDYKEYGIDNLEGFKTKFNLFTTGKTDKNIFDGLETVAGTSRWKHFAVSGSVMPACSQKRNPLIDQVCTPEMSFSDKMNRFFNEYYSESDIDVMCDSKSVFEFMDNIANLVDVIKKNLSSYAGKDVSGTVEVEPIKSLGVVVHTKFIEEKLQDIGDVSYVINNITSQAVKERFYEEYFACKRQKNVQFRNVKKGAFYEHFYKIVPLDDMNVMVSSYEATKETQYESDSDSYIYLNDILPADKKVPDDKNILVLKISESIKFKIRSPLMSHSIEAFRTRFDDYFSCVARFHLPCVRSYYNGENVYMLPSAITALMTYTNIDYKYFAGIRDPVDILDKYRTRGFGTIINDQEKSTVVEYNGSVNKWKGMFNVDPKNKASVTAHFGPKKLNDTIYKPGKFLKDYPDDTYRKVDCKYIMTVEDYYNYFKNAYGYVPGTIDFLKFRSLGEAGTFIPLKKWILEAANDELFQ
jgi:hypothetical protein